MKKILTTKKSMLVFVLASALVTISACTKQGVQPTVASQANSFKVNNAATALTKPAPGNYQVSLFVNDADTSTADFAGYVFTFKVNGTLIATVEKATYTGKWESKDNGKELKLDIDGTDALHTINKSWNVVKITTALINLNDPEHGINNRDKLVFTRLN